MVRPNPNRVLLIFVKYPEPGKVKTRLAKDIGKESAARIYREMAETVIRKLSKSKEYETIIFFDPPERKRDVENWLNDKHKLFPQEGKSLGEKMVNAFNKTFSLGVGKAVIIGTDCVEISDEIIFEAFDTLSKVDVVLGPAEDGGYYLLGLKQPNSEIFNDVQWSTNLVLNQTLEKLREKEFKFQLLKTLRDVDTVSDVNVELLLRLQENENR